MNECTWKHKGRHRSMHSTKSQDHGDLGPYIDARLPYTAISSSHVRGLRVRSLLLPELKLASSAALYLLSSNARCSLCALASAFFRFFISAFSALLTDPASPRDLFLPPPNGHMRPLVFVRDTNDVGEGERVSGLRSCCCCCCCVRGGTGSEVGGGEGNARPVTVPVDESVLERYMWMACLGCPRPSLSLDDDGPGRSVLVSVCVLFASFGCRNKRWT